eukprot:TRINITY_DN13077_c0_g1_i1.p1 TRINITY_DN13077_c0_g1~~TRINITY_DN13077_c0_g1_i1.p1  ORF type:complete len:552 (+),score=59.67 TRINITY_DN13077_c0_g1_i1:203-1858(+)
MSPVRMSPAATMEMHQDLSFADRASGMISPSKLPRRFGQYGAESALEQEMDSRCDMRLASKVHETYGGNAAFRKQVVAMDERPQNHLVPDVSFGIQQERSHLQCDAETDQKTSCRKRKRRTLLVHMTSLLREVSRTQRHEILANRLTQMQRLELEKFVMQQPKSGSQARLPGAMNACTAAETSLLKEGVEKATGIAEPMQIGGTLPFNRSVGVVTSVETPAPVATLEAPVRETHRLMKQERSTPAGTTPCGTAAITSSPASGKDPHRLRGIVSHEKGGRTHYYATLSFSGLIFRCKSRINLNDALDQLSILAAMRDRINDAAGLPGYSFEGRVRVVVTRLVNDRENRGDADLGLSIFLRIATAHWLGRELYTPACSPENIEVVLAAWRKLVGARGTGPGVGGSGLLCRQSPSEADATWKQLRSAYLEICATQISVCKMEALEARLTAMENAHAAHREREIEKWRCRGKARDDRAMRRRMLDERRQVILETRFRRAREKAEKRRQSAAVAAEKREMRAFRTLERLVATWSSRQSKTKLKRPLFPVLSARNCQ